MIICLAVLFGGVFGFQVFKSRMIKKYMASQGQQKQTVSTCKAGYQEWRPHFIAIGTLTAVLGADLAPEVNGIVKQIHFKSGTDVKKGTLLLQINADADLARLESLKAAEDLARRTLARDTEQFKVQAVSQATIDSDTANLKSARAQVAEQKALIDKKFIKAPFDGRLGIRAVDLGQYISPGQKIVTLQSLNPIFIDFYFPQKDISRLRVGQNIKVMVDAFPGNSFSGEISSISPKVDESTRNVPVRAKISNQEKKLLPGMFATANVEIGVKQKYITLPQTAISYNPYGDYVYVVTKKEKDEKQADLIVKQRFIDAGETRGDQVAVISGIKEGEIIVTSGQNKLKNDTPVAINNSISLPNNAAPAPVDE